MKRIIYTLIISSLAVLSAGAQQPNLAGIAVPGWGVDRSGDRLQIAFDLGYEDLDLNANEILTLIPSVVKNGDTVRLSPIVLAGNIRQSVVSRQKRLGNYEGEIMVPYEQYTVRRGQLQRPKDLSADRVVISPSGEKSMRYRYTIPYSEWMNGSSIVLEQRLSGCPGSDMRKVVYLGRYDHPVDARVMLLVPQIERVKARKVEMTSHINFEHDKYDIRPYVANNERELQRIYDFTREVTGNPDLKIDRIRVKGFASPEGRYSYNERLAGNRVEALRDHLCSQLSLDRGMFELNSEPEDWDSLRRWISRSDLEYRTQLLDIIDSTPDPDARDAKMRALDGGATYNMLLTEVYPQLRRVDYAIDYTVEPFTVAKGTAVMQTNPHHLSLNELYMIATSYPEDSDDYVRVFTIATQYYPDDPVANNNMGVIALRRGDHRTARVYLERVMNDPRCKNNIAVMLLRSGDREGARRLLSEAAREGSAEAAFNLANLNALR